MLSVYIKMVDLNFLEGDQLRAETSLSRSIVGLLLKREKKGNK